MHFLEVHDFEKEVVKSVTERGLLFRKSSESSNELLKGKKIGLFFEKPSMRTRVSFEVGIEELGGVPINLNAGEIQLGVREPIPDVARVLSRYLDAVLMRVNRHSDLEIFAEHSTIPVVNALSDLSHPCQAIADIMTICEFTKSDKPVVTYLGDGNNVCSSLIDVCNVYGFPIRVCVPPGYEPARDIAKSPYEVFHDPREACNGADVLYTDVWTSMGMESERFKRMKVFEPYSLTSELQKLANPDAIIMHCLPAHRGEEIQNEVIESENSKVFDQAENRLHGQKAILAELLG